MRLLKGSTSLCGFLNAPAKGTLHQSCIDWCEKHDCKPPKGKSHFDAALRRSFSELKLGPKQGVGLVKTKASGWMCHGLTLEKNRGERIVLPDPPIVKRFRQLPLFTMMSENGIVEPFNYKGWSNEDLLCMTVMTPHDMCLRRLSR